MYPISTDLAFRGPRSAGEALRSQGLRGAAAGLVGAHGEGLRPRSRIAHRLPIYEGIYEVYWVV